ncbi:MAG: UDP-3-O-(3-hydroxymyristoyl)glucosamine N-acyltransferase [Saezia sp.]
MQPSKQPVELGAIVDALGGELRGDPKTKISSIASIGNAPAGSITFLANMKFLSALATLEASAIILPASYDGDFRGNGIFTKDPYLYFAKLTQWWKKQVLLQSANENQRRISPSASIHPSAMVASSAIIGAGAVIEANAKIGERTWISAQAFIGEGVTVGDDCRIAPQVSILYDCKIGHRCIINSGAVIGGDGFGFAPTAEGERRWIKIEQLGAVTLGDDVEIGSNTCIDRGAIDDTIIGDGVKLDNVIQIGHNVHIGNDTLMASCTGISGSTHIGERCIVGGAVGMAGHLQIADDVTVMAATNVTKSITKQGIYSGIIPFDEASVWRKNIALLRHLSSMRDRIRELEEKVSQLTKN